MTSQPSTNGHHAPEPGVEVFYLARQGDDGKARYLVGVFPSIEDSQFVGDTALWRSEIDALSWFGAQEVATRALLHQRGYAIHKARLVSADHVRLLPAPEPTEAPTP